MKPSRLMSLIIVCITGTGCPGMASENAPVQTIRTGRDIQLDGFLIDWQEKTAPSMARLRTLVLGRRGHAGRGGRLLHQPVGARRLDNLCRRAGAVAAATGDGKHGQ